MINRFLSLSLLFFIIYFTYEIYLLDRFYFLCPIEYRNKVIIRKDGLGDGNFGSERKGNRRHTGIDLLAEIGTSIKAPRYGIILETGSQRGMGNYIEIQHPKNLRTIYGHLQRIFVYKGQRIRQGEIIGLVGKTGNAHYRGILSHLHFEVRKGDQPVDPLNGYLN